MKQTKQKQNLFMGGEWDGYNNYRIQGAGAVYFPNGDLYEGELRDGIAHGMGTLVMSNGACYRYDLRVL